MHHLTITLNSPLPHSPSPSPFHDYSFNPLFPHNPRLIFPSSSPLSFRVRPQSAFTCTGIHLSHSLPNHSPISLGVPANGDVQHWKLRSLGVKNIDVSTLGNLCVDIVLNVPKLPPRSPEPRKDYMDQLSASPPDKQYWEAGGNCNMAIAAARLGLRCATIGHVGNEIYGKFLQNVLHDEGISMVGMCKNIDVIDSSSTSYETLLCWVLVDPLQRHGFCSRADFSDEPAFSWMGNLSGEVKMAIKQSKVLFCNGYGFDELTPKLIVSALDYAVEVGTSVFFDPGPRGKSLSSGTLEEREALHQFLMMSDVLLLTSDEAESLTGIGDPLLAGKELLRKGIRTKWVIVKMGSRGSILITMSSISCAPAFKVDIIDTVGCGDSFVAAVAFGFIHKLSLLNTLTIANAVGAATAMGCGAGRNVATMEKVIEILKASNVNVDDEYWNDLIVNSSDAQEIAFLSKAAINGSDNHRLKPIPIEKVVSELLPKLESAKSSQLEGKVAS
ncbi:fructokinase-1 [Euphorbia lathyris]|uniref:fructokinase-1 n=1 Tax=Euphorbia lathyris TaxID=212925 RepID=UPI003313F2FD